MIITYDWEFHDDGKSIDPISLGMVAENGDTLYLVNIDANWAYIQTNEWLVANVLPHLPVQLPKDGSWRKLLSFDYDHPDGDRLVPLWKMAKDAEAFLWAHADGEHGPLADLWADYPATDHVLLYQLFGPMIECTKHGMPMRTSCLTQEQESVKRNIRRHLGVGPTVRDDAVTRLSVSVIGDWTYRRPEQDRATLHHALHDARHDMDLARWLELTEV